MSGSRDPSSFGGPNCVQPQGEVLFEQCCNLIGSCRFPHWGEWPPPKPEKVPNDTVRKQRYNKAPQHCLQGRSAAAVESILHDDGWANNFPIMQRDSPLFVRQRNPAHVSRFADFICRIRLFFSTPRTWQIAPSKLWSAWAVVIWLIILYGRGSRGVGTDRFIINEITINREDDCDRLQPSRFYSEHYFDSFACSSKFHWWFYGMFSLHYDICSWMI